MTMDVYRGLGEIRAGYGPVVATIGNFDGVHRGHQWVIEQVTARARELGVGSLAVTFDPHPARILRPEMSQPLLTPVEEKLRLLGLTGVDATLVLPFTAELSRMSARAFAEDVLRARLGVVELHEGENFRFGYQAEGGVETLEQMGPELGFRLWSYSPKNARGEVISSSRIREAVREGDLRTARHLLGRSFAVRSTPAPGRGYGTRYAVPTINLAAYGELLPANGVYVTEVTIGSGVEQRTFDAVTNVGNRPTFGADSFTVESHLLRFEPVALDERTPVAVTFLRRLRAEMRWESPEALREQIGRDVRAAERVFSLCRAVRSGRAGQPMAGVEVRPTVVV